MDKLKFVFAFFLVSSIVIAQNTSVEESTFGIQTGTLGIWIHNELKLTNSIALRSELGLDAGIYGGDIYRDSGFFLVPVITLEPRWYYNLNKRESKSKRIDGNSGNFISLKISYHPDIVIFSNDNVNFVNDISIVPTWGIRRNIGKHFNYEAGIGVGYIHFFNNDNLRIIDEPDVAVNLHLRIGYRF